MGWGWGKVHLASPSADHIRTEKGVVHTALIYSFNYHGKLLVYYYKNVFL